MCDWQCWINFIKSVGSHDRYSAITPNLALNLTVSYLRHPIPQMGIENVKKSRIDCSVFIVWSITCCQKILIILLRHSYTNQTCFCTICCLGFVYFCVKCQGTPSPGIRVSCIWNIESIHCIDNICILIFLVQLPPFIAESSPEDIGELRFFHTHAWFLATLQLLNDMGFRDHTPNRTFHGDLVRQFSRLLFEPLFDFTVDFDDPYVIKYVHHDLTFTSSSTS